MGLLSKIFGTRSAREIKKIQPLVDKILALEVPYSKLSEEELRGKTAVFKARLAAGETLDDLLPEAFAAIREASWRVLGMKPYPVQIIGGIVLHQGRIAEMKTGEGKTLVAILPCYLNALTGNGVHVVTVNDYLAKYQSEWMGKVYKYMGLTVGLVIPSVPADVRKLSYAADITYCTNNELGFDYLRDNMVTYKEQMVQRGHAFAIVDEVDSILIDEARTPLIISGKGENSSQLYELADQFVSGLRKKVFAKTEDKEVQDNYDCDYFVDEKARTVSLTAEGIEKAEKFFNVENLSDPENGTVSHHINQAMKARGLMRRDKDYVVKDGEIIIVDEFTGRLMYGRRYSDGLHQAIEAKEKVDVASESRTLATITFQNFFRLYDKLSGMTGTALTEEAEFAAIYQLDVVEIPTNRPVIRKDHTDAIYKTAEGKYKAIVEQIKACHQNDQPVLVGTVSIEKSELLSKLLKKEGIPHHVLNAKFHEQEAQIVAQAGKLGAVTIATNMAGRGTDIMLGGNPEFLAKNELAKQDLPDELLAEADSHAETEDPEILAIRAKYTELLKKYKKEIANEADRVKAAGGLFIIGTERHESRRIDNQLRGRSGRQGDPGESRFYLSLEDDLLRLFGNGRFANILEFTGVLDDEAPLQEKAFSTAVETAQKGMEGMHFRSRKNVLEYDNVMNTQREIIYAQRKKVLDGESLRESILSMLREVVDSAVMNAITQHDGLDDAALEEIRTEIGYCIPQNMQLSRDPDKLADEIYEAAVEQYEKKEKALVEEDPRELERVCMLYAVDVNWMEHIDDMDDLKQGIGLQAYGQHDPVVAYKEEGFQMFENMVHSIREQTVREFFSYKPRPRQQIKRIRVARETGTASAKNPAVKQQPVRNRENKIGPNQLCHCGSGLKYKKCCMQKDKDKARENQ